MSASVCNPMKKDGEAGWERGRASPDITWHQVGRHVVTQRHTRVCLVDF